MGGWDGWLDMVMEEVGGEGVVLVSGSHLYTLYLEMGREFVVDDGGGVGGSGGGGDAVAVAGGGGVVWAKSQY